MSSENNVHRHGHFEREAAFLYRHLRRGWGSGESARASQSRRIADETGSSRTWRREKRPSELPGELLTVDAVDYSELPLVRMRVIDEETQRQGRVIVNAGGPVTPFGSLENRFGCGACEALLAVGARLVVGKVLFKCTCGLTNEVDGVSPGRTTEVRNWRRFGGGGS